VFKTNLEEGAKQINLLWECNKEEKDKAVKLLLKIFGNILKAPNETKYHSISFAAMMKRFRNARPGLHILFAAGFSQTVDGTKIQIKPMYFDHLRQILALLEKKLAEPEVEKEPTPTPQLQLEPEPVEEQAIIEEKVEPKPQPETEPEPIRTQEHPEYMFELERGEAIVVLQKYGEAQKVFETLNGATIGENLTLKVELFFDDDDRERSKNQGLSIDSGDDGDAEPCVISKKVKISGLLENMPKSTLEKLVKNSTPCTIKEVYYKMKAGRGAALGGLSEFDELRSKVDGLRGNYTRLTNADVDGKTPEEKARIIKEKKDQYRRDKAKRAAEEAREKSASALRNRRAAFDLKQRREQDEMQEIIRQKKKAKERERRERERVRAKIKADKERRKREQQGR